MNNFKLNLNKIKNQKYKNTISNLSFLRDRNNYLKKILNIKNFDKLIPKKSEFKQPLKTKKIETELIFKNNKYVAKKEFNKLFIFFYKQFNFSLKLKKHYFKNVRNNKSKEVDLHTYLLFGNILIIKKKIDNLQKLNTICKINDITILNFKKKTHNQHIKLIKKNIKFEFKIKKHYAKKFIAYSSKY